MEEWQINSSVMGFHEYKNVWTPEIGQMLQCEMQSENPLDKYAVAVKLNYVVVGHLPLGRSGRFAKTIFSSELILKINVWLTFVENQPTYFD